ncbi:nonsense-mediated mRNA decay protein 1 [Colletotrichum orchidophilum]|uniref:Nonsense-mediated mRNA decay protein 1 n=1 Tax=Colletotrichum orchidophilum TaxID=1209926 RepID=A0A1G4BPR8_9PEZI|nr:nonsense-mediated mRNA decay protein 1 [Colletotrichum orchidophilum]OHF03461.1 nonsense-mediated mRNA decay protein 1 [Colletotrichum orchidophilum]
MLFTTWNVGYGPIDDFQASLGHNELEQTMRDTAFVGKDGHTSPTLQQILELSDRDCGRRMVHSFNSKDEFARVHREGTITEMANEASAIKRFNEAPTTRYAWVIAPVPGPYSLISSDLQKQWMVLVELPSTPERHFPDEGEMCKISFKRDFVCKGKQYNPGTLPAQRIPNPYETILEMSQYSLLAAFNVTMDYVADPATKEQYHPLLSIAVSQNMDYSLGQPPLNLQNATEINLRVDQNPVTYEAELMALSILTQPKKEANALSENTTGTFEYLLDFRKEPSFYVNMFDKIPHMDNPASHSNAFLQSAYSRLNRDHKNVYEQLRRIPAGLAIILGCPGAGKTALNAFISAMAVSQSLNVVRDDGKKVCKPVKVLYLLDVNYPCDDAADRVYATLKDARIKKSVIRVRGCAREMRNSTKLHPAPLKTEDDEPDFTAGFLRQARASIALSHRTHSPNENRGDRAPTLDEAAWERYGADRSQHKSLTKILEKLEKGAIKTKRTARELKSRVAGLYFSVIQDADFIATTPVAASGYLSKKFTPDIVFLDEAAHARELTALIPIALYSPCAFILTGDTRQTRPFVEGGKGTEKENVYAKQLMISTMERADLAGALKSKLLISHRMYGDLQVLASELFYDGQLTSGIPEAERFSDPVRHMQRWLGQFTRGQECVVPRILLNLRYSREMRDRSSFYNPVHENFIKQRCYELLRNTEFRQVSKPDQPGRILIITPYKAALVRYKQFIKVLPPHFRGRLDIELRFNALEARTVDSAQGHEADFVFVDTVRTRCAGFLDDPKRLCVMLSRARLGEMILMHEGMTKKWVHEQQQHQNAEWTTKVYDYCRKNGQLHYFG